MCTWASQSAGMAADRKSWALKLPNLLRHTNDRFTLTVGLWYSKDANEVHVCEGSVEI